MQKLTGYGYAIWCQRGRCNQCHDQHCECPHHNGGAPDPDILKIASEYSIQRGHIKFQCQMGQHARCKVARCNCKCHVKGEIPEPVEVPVASEQSVRELQERIYAAEASFTNLGAEFREQFNKEVIAAETVRHDIVEAVKGFDQRLATMEKAKQLEITVVHKDESGKKLKVSKSKLGMTHKDFEKLLRWTKRKRGKVWMVGPAGGGKTEAARQLCIALGFDPTKQFYPQSYGPQTTQAQLIGSISPTTGECIHSPAFYVFRDGGVYLGDELDAGHPGVMIVMNAIIENDYAAFGCKCGVIKRHPDAYFLVAANTFGKGADHLYVGRNQLDAATLNRFKKIFWDYDWDLTRAITQEQELTTYVERLSECVAEMKLRVVISPRQAMMLVEAVQDGEDRKEAEEVVIWADMSPDDKAKILQAMERKYPEPKWFCDMCDAKFMTELTLQDHRLAEHAETCPYCEGKFAPAVHNQEVCLQQQEAAASQLQQGYSSQKADLSDEVPVACPKCKKSNLEDNRTKNEQRKKANMKPMPAFKCKDCGWHRWPTAFNWKTMTWS